LGFESYGDQNGSTGDRKFRRKGRGEIYGG